MMPKSPAAFGSGPGGAPADQVRPAAVAAVPGRGGARCRGGTGAGAGAGAQGAPAASARRAAVARWRSSRPARSDPGCLRSPRWSLAPWPQVQAGASPEFEAMEAPTIGGVRVRKGNGETVRLPRAVRR